MVNMRNGLVTAAVLVGAMVIFLLVRRPGSAEFAKGTYKHRLLRIVLRGQGRSATLTDCASLCYLVALPKLDGLPQDIYMKNGLSFDVALYDKWGRLPGSVNIAVSTNKKVMSLSYGYSILSDASFSFILLDSNPPPRLQEMLNFLLLEENRGKAWPTNVH